jgi:hypothetical protein
MCKGRLTRILSGVEEGSQEMTPITAIAANEHLADLRRAAEARHIASVDRTVDAGTETEPQAILLHFARPDDSGVVRRLAALDDAPPLQGEVLLAFVAGEAVAALSLSDGRVVANPFVPTAHAVSLLRLRAEHLSRERSRRSWRTILRPRVALGGH